ncbi:uncharacterized protein K452DRAFT_293833 [Aplosporella prunicola CBS 121167]|uniref:Uncharacterized protein n=1 Tax=Aplosporella prunicola CBS 121167 TaxID=1176127 RepID=A0A6A6BU99_9PEZI|nr:uncharacterized protein K452DRAFT_293833 [Aplosporella prunicola CBS 121167]KAF2147408.1 hypothetical protein K452DRAFT_293833 [Aplosporella prunicola CBS 121167]
MEAAGLAVSAYKGVYLVSRFLYKTAISAKHYNGEQKDLLLEFLIGFLRFRALWKVLVDNDGEFVEGKDFQQEWLSIFSGILEEICVCFLDYAKIVDDFDEEYQKYSSY